MNKQQLIDTLKQLMTQHANSANHDKRYYTKDQVDTTIDGLIKKNGDKMTGNLEVPSINDIKILSNHINEYDSLGMMNYVHDWGHRAIFVADWNSNTSPDSHPGIGFATPDTVCVITSAGNIYVSSKGNDETASEFTCVSSHVEQADWMTITPATANLDRWVYFGGDTTSAKTKLAYDDSFKYNPLTKILTVKEITGKASSATKDGSDNVITERYVNHDQNPFIHRDEVIAHSAINTFKVRDSGTYGVTGTGSTQQLTVFRNPGASSNALELFNTYDLAEFKVRCSVDGNRYTAWKNIAFTDSNVASATKLATARTIFGQSFNGSANVAGRALFYGYYTSNASMRYTNSGIEVRENGLVANGQSDIGYAPAIGFHWSNRVAGTLALGSDAKFRFLTQNGGTGTLIASLEGNASKASTLSRGGGDNAGMTFNWSGQAGQPPWLWGGTDGVNMYVYNPSNFDVHSVSGYAASTASAANTLVARDTNNYTHLYYIESASPASENPAISQFIVTNASDNFYRKASLAHVKSALGLSSYLPLTGGTLTGNLYFQNRGQGIQFKYPGTTIMAGQIYCNDGSDYDLTIEAPSGFAVNAPSAFIDAHSMFYKGAVILNYDKVVDSDSIGKLTLEQGSALVFKGDSGRYNVSYPGFGVPKFSGAGTICANYVDGTQMLYVAAGHYPGHIFMSIGDTGGFLDFVAIEDGIVSCTRVNSRGGDYAEYWEWEDGNPDSDDRVGFFVTFTGKNIRIAKKDDNLCKIGVVSAIPSIIGNSDNKEWVHKYQKDIYGRDIWKDVEIEQEDGSTIKGKDRVLNPEYDETKKYIKRVDRPEWDAVGTHGKLIVRDDGTCQPDGFCIPADGGVATKSDTDNGFYVMERLDENHIRIYMR